MNPRIAEHLKPLAGSALSWVGAITTWQEHIEWFVKVGAGAAAFVASVVTIRSILRKDKKPSE